MCVVCVYHAVPKQEALAPHTVERSNATHHSTRRGTHACRAGCAKLRHQLLSSPLKPRGRAWLQFCMHLGPLPDTSLAAPRGRVQCACHRTKHKGAQYTVLCTLRTSAARTVPHSSHPRGSCRPHAQTGAGVAPACPAAHPPHVYSQHAATTARLILQL